ncbi:MAG: PulJ/GspJ family protein [Candidatus Rifleibacteriota bacterium]
MYQAKRNKNGFTLVEILIAAGVLSLFLVGLFSFYRMGSRMFMTGSWKLNKQKEMERFITNLKERIEQASNAVQVEPGAGAPDDQMVESASDFVTVENDTTVLRPEDDTRLILFSICKPDMTAFGNDPAQPGQGPGLILHHCLMARPAAKKLYTLYFHANTDRVAHSGIDYFNSPVDYFPDMMEFTAPEFNAPPSVFSLGNAPYTIKLTEVFAASFTVEIASGTDAMDDTEKIIGVDITCQHPRYEATKVSQSFKARIDFSVPVNEMSPGDF